MRIAWARRACIVARLVPGVALLLLMAGCSFLSRGGAPEPSPVEPAAESVAPADTAVTFEAIPAEPDSAQASSALPDSAIAPAMEASPVDPVQAEANDQVQFELSDRERNELLVQATKTLGEIRARLDKLDRASLGADRQQKLLTIESLAQNAEDAMGDDVRAAATLSRKARLLLDDLVAQ